MLLTFDSQVSFTNSTCWLTDSRHSKQAVAKEMITPAEDSLPVCRQNQAPTGSVHAKNVNKRAIAAMRTGTPVVLMWVRRGMTK